MTEGDKRDRMEKVKQKDRKMRVEWGMGDREKEGLKRERERQMMSVMLTQTGQRESRS